MDATEYKHVVLGLIFLKYISASFFEKYEELQAEEYAEPENRDDYSASNIFSVPTEAMWNFNWERNKPEAFWVFEGIQQVER